MARRVLLCMPDQPARRNPMPTPTSSRTIRCLVSTAMLLLAGTACAGGASPTAADREATVDSLTPGLETEANPPGPPPAPKACQAPQDCQGACPPGSKGCTCATTPRGDSVCAPSCSVDADCPAPPGMSGKCERGVCAPPPPPRPKTCQSASDCTDACPPGSRACTCAATPHGEKVCAPACSADADCPSVPGVPLLHCHDGSCAPPPPQGG